MGRTLAFLLDRGLADDFFEKKKYRGNCHQLCVSNFPEALLLDEPREIAFERNLMKQYIFAANPAPASHFGKAGSDKQLDCFVGKPS